MCVFLKIKLLSINRNGMNEISLASHMGRYNSIVGIRK